MANDDVTRQIEAFKRHLEDMKLRADSAQYEFVTTVCNEVERTAKTLMRDTETNPDVTYGTKGHHPSMPGSAPAVDTGALRQSITHSVEVDSSGNVTGYVGSIIRNPPYGAYLEFGTSKMKPRPWLSTAVIKCRSFMQQVSDRIYKRIAK